MYTSDESLLGQSSEELSVTFPLDWWFTMQNDDNSQNRFRIETELDNSLKILDFKYLQTYKSSADTSILVLVDNLTKYWYAFVIVEHVPMILLKNSKLGKKLNKYLHHAANPVGDSQTNGFGDMHVIKLKNYRERNVENIKTPTNITYRSPLKRRLRTTVRLLPRRVSRFFKKKVALPMTNAYNWVRTKVKTQRRKRQATKSMKKTLKYTTMT
jgi:hypothetical protein